MDKEIKDQVKEVLLEAESFLLWVDVLKRKKIRERAKELKAKIKFVYKNIN